MIRIKDWIRLLAADSGSFESEFYRYLFFGNLG